MVISTPNVLPSDISNALVIFLFCFLVVWAYRLILKGCLITDLSLSIDHHAVYRVEGHTEEQIQMEGGFIPRAHFEKLLRNRRIHLFPPVTVEKVNNPVHMIRKSLSLVNLDVKGKKEKKEFEDFGVSFEFGCCVPCDVAVHWGVNVDSMNEIVTLPKFNHREVEDDEELPNHIEMSVLSPKKPRHSSLSSLLHSLPSHYSYRANFPTGTHKFMDKDCSFPSNRFAALPPFFFSSSCYPLVIVLSSNDSDTTKYTEIVIAHFHLKSQADSSKTPSQIEDSESASGAPSSSQSEVKYTESAEDYLGVVLGQYLIVEKEGAAVQYELKVAI